MIFFFLYFFPSLSYWNPLGIQTLGLQYCTLTASSQWPHGPYRTSPNPWSVWVSTLSHFAVVSLASLLSGPQGTLLACLFEGTLLSFWNPPSPETSRLTSSPSSCLCFDLTILMTLNLTPSLILQPLSQHSQHPSQAQHSCSSTAVINFEHTACFYLHLSPSLVSQFQEKHSLHWFTGRAHVPCVGMNLKMLSFVV